MEWDTCHAWDSSDICLKSDYSESIKALESYCYDVLDRFVFERISDVLGLFFERISDVLDRCVFWKGF